MVTEQAAPSETLACPLLTRTEESPNLPWQTPTPNPEGSPCAPCSRAGGHAHAHALSHTYAPSLIRYRSTSQTCSPSHTLAFLGKHTRAFSHQLPDTSVRSLLHTQPHIGVLTPHTHSDMQAHAHALSHALPQTYALNYSLTLSLPHTQPLSHSQPPSHSSYLTASLTLTASLMQPLSH